MEWPTAATNEGSMGAASLTVTSGSASPASVELGGLCVTELSFPPRLRLASHYHQRACFAVVLEGSVRKSFRQASHDLVAPGVVTMPAHERHEDRFEEAGAHILVVEATPDGVKQLSPIGALFEEIHLFRDPGLAGIAWRIRSELRAPDVVTPLALQGLVLELLATAAREFGSVRRGGLRPNWLARVEEVLRQCFADPPDVDALATEAGVHPAHLSRVFRAWHGQSLGRYVRGLRLDWVARQLAVSDLSLSELALQAGFADQSHMTREFKRYAGFSPGHYRSRTNPHRMEGLPLG